MFNFANPLYLLLAFLIPPLLWWRLRQRTNVLRHPAVHLLAGLPRGRARMARWGGAFLRGLALLLLVAALAGPRWPDRSTRIPTEGIAILLAVDVSGSMAETDFDWQGAPVARLDAVKKVFRLFVAGSKDEGVATPDGADPERFPGRPTDLVGLVTFATRPETRCPLTLSHSVPLRLLDAERPRRLTGESETNVSDAVTLGLHRLQGANTRRKVLILLSDGEHNVVDPRSGWTPRQVAQLAVSLEIPIYTIDAGAGSAEGVPALSASPVEVRQEATRTLQDLARISGGSYFAARDTEGLLRAYEAIDRMERTDIRSFQYRRYHEAYPWVALGSFALFVLAGGLDRSVWRRLP